MVDNDVESRLAAILAADVVGYSRLIGQDEEGTLAALRQLRAELVDPKIGEHKGRLFKTTGDGFLVEFPSVVNAVACAVDIQKGMVARNAELPRDHVVQFRIGVNVGDVVIEGEDVFGDGVNVASRLEGVAAPGGIVVSGTVRDHIGNRLDLDFRDMGKLQLKNIADAVRTYSIGQGEKIAQKLALAEQKKPSIAVLPLINMSGDSEQEYFADGLTEDVITELSRFKELFVIARNSTFVYKGKSVKIQDVARELNVHYVVEGSVRKAGARVRITVQLIDADSGQHIWAERYDRQLEDIFAIQDEVTTAIVSVLSGRIEAARRELASNKPTESMEAYEQVLGGKVLHHRSDRTANAEALKMLDRAIELDPKYAHAHAWRACVLGQRWAYNWGDRAELWREIIVEANTALALDDSDADVHRLAAAIGIITSDLSKAQFHQNRALALNPNYDLVVVQQGEILTWLGQGEEGAIWIKRAMQLNPFHPNRYWSHLGRSHLTAELYIEAADALRRLNDPSVEQVALLAAAYVGARDIKSAETCTQRALELSPDISVHALMSMQHYTNQVDTVRLREQLLSAGLPE